MEIFTKTIYREALNLIGFCMNTERLKAWFNLKVEIVYCNSVSGLFRFK